MEQVVELEQRWQFSEALAARDVLWQSCDAACEDAAFVLESARCALAADQLDVALAWVERSTCGSPEAALLRTHALVGLGRADEAAACARHALQRGAASDVHAALEELLREALARQHPAVAVALHPEKGRVLVSRVDASPGQVMLHERPLMVWGAAKPAADNERELPGVHFVEAFVALPNDQQRETVLKMCCMAQNPSDAVALVSAARAFRRRHAPRFDGIPLRTLVALGVIERLNAHSYTGPGADIGAAETPTSALFDVMTKASHLCRPNCIYDASREAYVAMRPIARGEEVGFPYFERSCLAQSASVRSTVLRHTHLIARCHCVRCTRDRQFGDFCRGIVCGTPRCTGTRYRRDVDMGATAGDDDSCSRVPTRQAQWHCAKCDESWFDTEMPLSREEALSGRVHAAWAKRSAPAKGSFEALKDLLIDVGNVLGRRHWTYLFLLETAVEFFFHVASKGSQRTADVARSVATTFLHKYIATAIRMRLHEDAPLLVAEAALSGARRLNATAPHLRADVVVLTVTARALADVAVIFPNSVDAAWLLEQSEASALYKAGDVDVTAAWRSVEGGDAIWRKAKEDDTDTLGTWEDHLTQRVVGEMRGAKDPRLPVELRQAMAGMSGAS